MPKGTHGGARPNSGPEKGAIYEPTRQKALAREALMKLVIAELPELVKAQITNAKGLSHFFMRDERTKQFKQVSDPAMIEAALNAGDEDAYYWIHSKDPSTQAFTALLDRAIDKPTEHAETEVKGTITLAWKGE